MIADEHDFGNLRELNKQFKPFRDYVPDDASDVRSSYSYSSSTASTIAPDVIKKRVKAALAKRSQADVRRRMKARGEANAVTRTRRETRDNIKQSQDAFWMG